MRDSIAAPSSRGSRTMATTVSTYEQLRADVEAQMAVPERFNFVADTFERWRSDRLAILWLDDAGGERRYSWTELSADVDRVANVLRASGVRKGDRVFIQVGRVPEWWQTMLACLKIGAIAMPGTVMLTPKDIAYRISLSEPVAVVTRPRTRRASTRSATRRRA